MPLFRGLASLAVEKDGATKRRSKIARRERARGEEGRCSSLARLCLWSLAENMKDVWTKDYTEKYIDHYSFRYVMGPFNMLPGELVEDLLSLLSSRRLVTRAALHLLLLPQLRSLSLATCSTLVSPGLCNIIGIRCTGLSSLDLSGAQQISTSVLVELLGVLPRLRSLSLAGTACDGGVVSVVGASCPALQSLDVSRCHHLAPGGLLRLAHQPHGYTGLPLRSLQALDIGLGEEEPDRAAAAAFLLLALPLLSSVALEGLGEACALIAGRHFGEAEEFTARAGVPSLREVWGQRVRGEFERREGKAAAAEGKGQGEAPDGEEQDGWPSDAQSEDEDEEEEEGEGGKKWRGRDGGKSAWLSGGEAERGGQRRGDGSDDETQVSLCLREAQGVSWETLGALGRLCSELRSLSLNCDGVLGGKLARALAKWVGQLHSLSLQSTATLFELIPAVRAVGASLLSLSLEGVKMDGTASFLQLLYDCPKLKTLCIHTEPPNSNEEEDEDQNLRDLPCLPQLRSLTLNFFLDQRQTKPVMSWMSLKWALLALLGGSPLLESASLVAVPCLMDLVFQAVLGHRPEAAGASACLPLQHLRYLSLTRCNISGETARQLVASINCLTTLDLSGCWNVTLPYVLRLRKNATRRRHPLTVIWT
ncbi:hypothetical protein MATL_G00064740 [Megalops atlanticus]|uniref:Uncharacterized protein n=1 Tax=Megalops atlanticus TaxID=7932 RepID=A0A9D3Q8N5_MEGAT|nr:hypothetical protein MATL_G00064740 [Megalops atlanticus]